MNVPLPPHASADALCHAPEDWSGRWESNPRHSAWEADVLPLNYARDFSNLDDFASKYSRDLAGNLALAAASKLI